MTAGENGEATKVLNGSGGLVQKVVRERATSARRAHDIAQVRERERERASFLAPIKERRPRENFNNPRFAGVCQYLNNVP